MHELREHPRFLFKQPIAIMIEGNKTIGESRDISMGGLFVTVADERLELHEEFAISLRLGQDGVPAEYTAQVVHVRRDSGGHVIGAGFSLVKTSREARLAWVRHIHYIEAHAGARVV